MGHKGSRHYQQHGVYMKDLNNPNLANFQGIINQHGLINPEFLAYQQQQLRYMQQQIPQSAPNIPLKPLTNPFSESASPRRSPASNSSFSSSNKSNNSDSNNGSVSSRRSKHSNSSGTPNVNDSRTVIKKDNAPTKTSMLQELLECPICMNLYDNPHVLPCQHTFCKKCIVSLQHNETINNTSNATNNTIDCPICREKHKLPNGVDSLTANYTMKRLIELESMAAEKRKRERKGKRRKGKRKRERKRERKGKRKRTRKRETETTSFKGES